MVRRESDQFSGRTSRTVFGSAHLMVSSLIVRPSFLVVRGGGGGGGGGKEGGVLK